MTNVILETKNNENNGHQLAAIEPLKNDERLDIIKSWVKNFKNNQFVNARDYIDLHNIEHVMLKASNDGGYFALIIFSKLENNEPCYLQFNIVADGSIKSKSFSNDKMGEHVLGRSSTKDDLILDIVLKDILEIHQYKRVSNKLDAIYDI